MIRIKGKVRQWKGKEEEGKESKVREGIGNRGS